MKYFSEENEHTTENGYTVLTLKIIQDNLRPRIHPFYKESYIVWENEIIKGSITAKTISVLPETVGQFTGLTDKNGKKIFEGDIVRERGGESYQGYYEIDNVLTVKIPDILVNFEMSYDCEYKIIGNIYDNPELIETEG